MRRFGLFLTCTLLTLAVVEGAGRGQAPTQDPYGDPLPEGAVARFGSTRFRHDALIVFASFLPGGQRVLSVGNDGAVCIWEFPSGKQIRRFDAIPAKDSATATPAKATGASLSQDAKHLLVFCSDGFLRIYDWAEARELGKAATAAAGAGKGGAATTYSPDGKTVMLSGSSRVLQFVDVPSAKDVGPSVGHATGLTAVSFTADGGQVLTKDAKSNQTWDANTGKNMGGSATKVTMPPKPGTPTVFSPDGKYGITVSRFAAPADANAAKKRDAILFDAANGKEIAVIGLEVIVAPTHNKPLVFSPDGKMLAAAAGKDKPKIELFEIPKGQLLLTLDAGPNAPPNKAGKAAPANAQKMLFSHDNKALAFQAGPGAEIVVLETATGKQMGSIAMSADDTKTSLSAFSPDGRCLAMESGSAVTLYELATGKKRHSYAPKAAPPDAADSPPKDKQSIADLLAGGDLADLGLGGPFGGAATSAATGPKVAFSPDGKLLAHASAGHHVHLWDVANGQELAVFKGHSGAVNAVAFSPNGRTLASASEDTTALLWDIVRVKQAASIRKGATADLETRWQALAGDDASQAFAAIGALVGAPTESVAFIKERLRPAGPLDMKRVEELIAQLDDNQYKVREVAANELLKLGEQLLPVLDKALAANPPLDPRGRLADMKTKLTGWQLRGERLRGVRAVEVLEWIGTPEARQLLQTLADGQPGVLLTTSAQSALKRLGEGR
jgi:WD40 repeat protein